MLLTIIYKGTKEKWYILIIFNISIIATQKFFGRIKMHQLCTRYPRVYHPYLYGMTVSIKTYTIIRTVRGDIMLLISSLDSLNWSRLGATTEKLLFIYFYIKFGMALGNYRSEICVWEGDFLTWIRFFEVVPKLMLNICNW